MHNRMKELRKNLGLTQKDFAKRLKLSQNHFSYLEKGERPMTERFIKDLCVEFNVNENWLRTGEGDMYKDALEKYNIDDPEVKEFLRLYLKTDDETKKYISELIKKILKEE